jgi:hypothetical protein
MPPFRRSLPSNKRSPCRRSAAPRRRTSPSGAPRGGEDARPPSLSLSPASPVPLNAHRRFPPPLAAGRRLSPLTPQLGSPPRALSPSLDPSQNRGRERVIAFLRRRPPRAAVQAAAGVVPPPPEPSSAPPPSDQDPTAQFQSSPSQQI